MLRHLKLMRTANKKIRKYLSKSNVTNFQTLLAFTTRHIPIKLHQFLISSFPDFLWTERVRNRQTDTQRQMPLERITARSMRTRGTKKTHTENSTKITNQECLTGPTNYCNLQNHFISAFITTATTTISTSNWHRNKKKLNINTNKYQVFSNHNLNIMMPQSIVDYNLG